MSLSRGPRSLRISVRSAVVGSWSPASPVNSHTATVRRRGQRPTEVETLTRPTPPGTRRPAVSTRELFKGAATAFPRPPPNSRAKQAAHPASSSSGGASASDARRRDQLVVDAGQVGDVLVHRIHRWNPGTELVPESGRVHRGDDRLRQVGGISDREVEAVDAGPDLLGHSADVAADHGPPVHERLLDDERGVLPPARGHDHPVDLRHDPGHATGVVGPCKGDVLPARRQQVPEHLPL